MLVFAAAAVFLVWLFLFSPVFKITAVRLPENEIVSSDDVYKYISAIAPLNLGKNLLYLPTDRLESELAANYPEITDIVISKKPFHNLTVDFQKRIQIGIWCGASNCYYIDKSGVIFKEAPQTEGSLVLKINDTQQSGESLGNRVLSGDALNFMMDFKSEIESHNQFKIIEFNIKPAEDVDLEALTDGGWRIYLDAGQNPSAEAGNLFAALNGAIKNKQQNLKYVDARVAGRIFYK